MTLIHGISNLSSMSLYEQAIAIMEFQEEVRIYDPNHLSSILKIEPGEVGAFFEIASYEESQIVELLEIFNGNQYLVKFLVQNPQYIALIIENVDSINWDKPISSCCDIIEQNQPSMSNLVENLSYGYLNALASQMKVNDAHKKLHSAVRSGMNNGFTSKQLAWFIDVLVKDYQNGSTLFTGGEMSAFSNDIAAIKTFCKQHFGE